MTAADERHVLAKELFRKARKLDEAGRRSFLDDACRDDSELRAEVESLLKHDRAAEANGFLASEQEQADGVGLSNDTDTTGQPLSASSEDGQSERVGSPPQFAPVALPEKYSVVTEAGRGAMGVVYRARHKVLDLDVAIKVVHPECSVERFRKEAQVLASISSPHVVSVRDYDVLSDGRPIIVMEWIDGESLEAVMANSGGQLAEHVALPWMKQTCQGMLAAAEQGVIHRDLKPSNILIDRRGTARVADFGLARGPNHPPGLSASHAVMGTAYYMAPEQAEDPRGVDTRADIYSFGACFYHALTGVPPFDGPSAFAVLFKHKTEPLVSPRSRNGELSEPTCQLLERCLAKSPTDRFQSFAELISFLESAPWHELDDAELSDYVAQFNLRREDYLLRRTARNEPDIFRFPNGRTLRILVGNLTNQEADVIVSSSDSRLAMDWGVSAAIRRAGGDRILEEAQRYAPARAGRAVVTSAGNLQARFVFHGITVGGQTVSHDLISEILASCLYHADTFGVRSLAFPLLGTGAGGFAEDECLDVMFRSLARTLLRGVTTVRDVAIVVSERPQLELLGSTCSFFLGDDEGASWIADSSDGVTLAPSRERPVESIDLFADRMEARPIFQTFDSRRLSRYGYKFAEYYRPTKRITAVGRASIGLGDQRIAILLADAAGHGIAASLLLQKFLIRAPALLWRHDAGMSMHRLNDELLALGTERFVAALLVVLDPLRNELTVVSAGQRPPMLRRASGEIEVLASDDNGLALGITLDADYQPVTTNIEPGDLLLIHNDALAEAMNDSGELYGLSRIREQVGKHRTPQSLVDNLVQDIQTFAVRPAQDDMCLICLARQRG